MKIETYDCKYIICYKGNKTPYKDDYVEFKSKKFLAKNDEVFTTLLHSLSVIQ